MCCDMQISSVLSGMVTKLVETPSVRLLKHVVRCYLRSSEHLKARDALKLTLPEALRDQTFSAVLGPEEAVLRWLSMLIKNLNNSDGVAAATNANTGFAAQPVGTQGTWQQYASLSESTNPMLN